MALQKDLQTLDLAPSYLLQYVDDFLLYSPTQKLCFQHTAKLLEALGSWAYQVSRSKAQTAQTAQIEVTNLGLSAHQQRAIPPGRSQALSDCPPPKTKRERLSLLGLLNFFRNWTPSFSLIAKPLYEATKGSLDEPLLAGLSYSPAHPEPAPSANSPPARLYQTIFLCAHSNQGQALGLLCQRAGDTWAPRAYLSKQLDTVTKGWPPYIPAMATITALVPEANKLSRHAPLTVCSPHTLRDQLSHRAFLPLPSSRVQILHVFFLDPQLSFSPCTPFNPASLLPTPSITGPPLHSCSLTVDLTPNPFQHLTDQPILEPDTPHWFTDGSSQKSPPFTAGYAIIQGDLHHDHGTQIIETSPLPPHTTSQQAGLIALTQALTLAKNGRLQICL